MSNENPDLKDHNLSYSDEAKLNIKRQKRGRGYSFIQEDGSLISAPRVRKRLMKVAVPPSYQDVRYCIRANGHLQATGYDSQGKKQYFYHPTWQALQDRKKYSLMAAFGNALPAFRRKLARTLRSAPSSEKEQLVCALIRILDRTGIRIGSWRAARHHGTYGLITLRRKHLKTNAEDIRFEFTGKGGNEVVCEIHDPLVQDVLEGCEEIPGQWLFDYRDQDGDIHHIHSQDINAYIKTHMGEQFSAKDFRTWRFNAIFLYQLMQEKDSDPASLKDVLHKVSGHTCNSAAILRSSYIHPALLELCRSGGWNQLHPADKKPYLRKYERYLLSFLRNEASGN